MDGYGALSSGAMRHQGHMRQANLLNKESAATVLLWDQQVFLKHRGMRRVRASMDRAEEKEELIPFGAAASMKQRRLR